MKLEARTYNYMDEKGRIRYAYDIVDLDDIVVQDDKELPELVAEAAQSWANESSAELNAVKQMLELRKSK